MPVNFRLPVPTEMRLAIAAQTAAIRAKRNSGEFCSYPQFVENLGKPMPRIQDELHHHTTGMAGEAGELLDATKKVWVYDKPVDLENIVEEMGDLRWYYQSMLNMLGLTDEDIQAANTAKLMKRYPSGAYSNAQAIARADKQRGADRKFIGMPQKEPLTRDPSTYVSSSENKPLPEDTVKYDHHCSLTLEDHAQLEERLRDRSAHVVHQEHQAVMRELGHHSSDGQEHSEIMREILGG